MVHPGGLLGCASPLRAVAEATLSSLVLAANPQTLKQQPCCYLGEYGASGRIRTSDRSVRSRVLYPAELRMHRDLLLYYSIFISLRKQYEVIDGASGRITRLRLALTGRCLSNVIFPGACEAIADHETATSLLSLRRWCIREDSNLRPLGS